jgi:hypothetical protein
MPRVCCLWHGGAQVADVAAVLQLWCRRLLGEPDAAGEDAADVSPQPAQQLCTGW